MDDYQDSCSNLIDYYVKQQLGVFACKFTSYEKTLLARPHKYRETEPDSTFRDLGKGPRRLWQRWPTVVERWSLSSKVTRSRCTRPIGGPISLNWI